VTRERDELAAELAVHKEDAARDADLAQQLAAAQKRIRVLEIQVAAKGQTPPSGASTRSATEASAPEPEPEVELDGLLEAKPAKVSDQAGKRAIRHNFKPTTKVQLDRTPALLVDLSVTGAQVICANPPEVGKIVKVALLSEEVPCFCEARLLWARREQTPKGKPSRYRAGLVFTAADEDEIEAFIKEHAIS